MSSDIDTASSPADPSFMIDRNDGMLRGPLRGSRNEAIDKKGSIHEDATAERLGFRGGTVAGSIHMELFPPLLIEAFGPRWFERGTLSLYFRNPTTDGELVRALVEAPSSKESLAHVAVRIDREDGLLVGEGTASAGAPDDRTALGQRDLQPFPPGELRILEGFEPGQSLGEHEGLLTSSRQRDRLPVVTEVLDWYRESSPWGAPVLTPASEVSLLYDGPVLGLAGRPASAVGLFSAIELRHFNGPLLADVTYRVTGTILAVGQSPKTEYVWFDTEARDGDGLLVGGMRMQLRWMKASSDRYRDTE
jgi:hypothetical protein